MQGLLQGDLVRGEGKREGMAGFVLEVRVLKGQWSVRGQGGRCGGTKKLIVWEEVK